MYCLKCSQQIADDSLFCKFCGEGQLHKRNRSANGTGTVCMDKRYKKPFIAHAPAAAGGVRPYLGSYFDEDSARKAIADYLAKGRPELYNASVKNIYDLWSETHYKEITDKTAECCRSVWKHFAPIASMRMSDVRTAHLQHIVNLNSGAGTVHSIKVLAKALCRFAVENDILIKNYADFIKLPKSEKAEKIVFSTEQIETLWEHSDDRNVQAILAMIYMGFRICEISALKAENIRFDEGYVISGSKTDAGKDRLIPFPEQIPEIKEFFASWVENAGENGRLFPFTDHSFRINVFYVPLIKLGMIDAHIDKSHNVVFHEKHHLTPHSTRHTFATLSVEAGIRPEYLQRIIGHASFRTTAEIYLHLTPEMLTAEMGKLKKPGESA